MIMTKTKPQMFVNEIDKRMTSTESLIPEGSYTIKVTQNSNTIRKASEQGSADFFVMGMVIPAHKAAVISQMLHDHHGLMPSPVLMLKSREGLLGVPSDRNAATTLPAESVSEQMTSSSADAAVIRIKDIEINPGRHEVKVKGRKVTLTFSEFRILYALAGKPGWVFDREKIIHAVHGENYNCTARAVDVQVTGLRKKLGHAGDYIQTVRGVGYRFVD